MLAFLRIAGLLALLGSQCMTLDTSAKADAQFGPHAGAKLAACDNSERANP